MDCRRLASDERAASSRMCRNSSEVADVAARALRRQSCVDSLGPDFKLMKSV